MKTHRIAAMGGDGIGPEVVDAAVEALKVCAERDGGFALEFTDGDTIPNPLGLYDAFRSGEDKTEKEFGFEFEFDGDGDDMPIPMPMPMDIDDIDAAGNLDAESKSTVNVVEL